MINILSLAKIIHKDHRGGTMNSIILSNFSLFANVVFMHLLLTRKRSIKYTSFIFVINLLVMILGYKFSYVFSKYTIYYKYLSNLLGITFFIYIYLIFEESVSKKIFTMFTIWLFSNIILIICSYIVSLFSIKDFTLNKYFSILLRNLIQLVFIPIIFTYFKNPYKEMLKSVSNKVINITSFYSIVIFLALIWFYKKYPYKFINSYGFIDSIIVIMIIILSYIIIFIAIWSANKNMKLEYKLKIIDTQVELQKQNYRTLNKSLENYYSFKHDIRHHVMVMKSMIDTKNYIAASEYVNKFSETEICNSVDMLCKNLSIDSIMKYYMSIAIKSNIEFKINLKIPENINIDNLDLSIVIGNCVENAIEACNKIIDERPKYIDIKAEIKGYNLLVKIKNSFNGQVLIEGNNLKTTKKSDGHGIGVSNVRKIAKKYNGFFDIKYTDSEFEVYIIMNFN